MLNTIQNSLCDFFEQLGSILQEPNFELIVAQHADQPLDLRVYKHKFKKEKKGNSHFGLNDDGQYKAIPKISDW